MLQLAKKAMIVYLHPLSLGHELHQFYTALKHAVIELDSLNGISVTSVIHTHASAKYFLSTEDSKKQFLNL